MDTTVASVSSDRLRLTSYVVVAIALGAAVGAGTIDLRYALLPVAALLGWSHLRSI